MSRADLNQSEIVSALRSIGVTVHITSQVGNGFPDLVCGVFGKNYLMEVKNPDTRGKLSTEQRIFRDNWRCLRPSGIRQDLTGRLWSRSQ